MPQFSFPKKWIKLGLLAMAFVVSAVQANDSVRFINGFPAGGMIDTVTRVLAESAKPQLGPAIVENRTGGSGMIAITSLKNAMDAGNSIVITPAAMITIFPSSYGKLTYDPQTDLIPVANIATFQLAIFVSRAHPANNVQELRQWLQANASKASFGTPGNGTSAHLGAIEFLRSVGLSDVPFVHYRGDPPEVLDVIGGALPVGIATTAVVEQQRDKLKVIAVTGPTRHAHFPTVPTLRESGLDLVLEEWIGAFVSKNTPPEKVNKLNQALNQAIRQPKAVETFRSLGIAPTSESPEAFTKRIQADTQRWASIVKKSGFKAD